MTRIQGGAAALCLVAGFGLLAAAQQNSQKGTKAHRAVIEITAGAPDQWEAVLNNVENLLKALSPDAVEIEVVAHGKALPMFLKTNTAQAERLAKIAGTGVKFAACENTMRRMNVQRTDLFDFVITVDSGVAEVVRKQEAGWAYLKGGG